MTWISWVTLLLPAVTTAILGIYFNTKLENHRHILQKKYRILVCIMRRSMFVTWNYSN